MMLISSEKKGIDCTVDSLTSRVCPYCFISFNHSKDLGKHILKHERIKPYICPECQKGFAYKHHMRDHMRVHTGEKPFKCKKCYEAFCWKVQLRRHEQTVHPQNI